MNGARDAALDALRGLAVLGMVLSGSIGFGASAALPAWTYHVQVPLPLHQFNPALAGIGWVDLVFPMFLFALGAALPLALRGQSVSMLGWTALRRGALLLYFALFTQQFKAAGGAAGAQALALLAFVLLGLQLVRVVPLWLKGLAWALALGLWWQQGFELQRRDIILAVLALMACVGSLLWGSTRPGSGREPWRWWIMLALVAVMLAPPSAWTRTLQATPAAWAYQFTFLKYLLIVVPGMAVGDWLAHGTPPTPDRCSAALAFTLVVINLSLLYRRETALNAALSLALLAWGMARARRLGGVAAQTWSLAAALLLLGLLLEPLQGGIRKDPSTFSYLLVTAGLSLLMLLALQTLRGAPLAVLAGLGRNPLLAYVAGSLCLLPLLHLSGLHAAWAGLVDGPAQALLKGLLFTGAAVLLTLAANRLGWIWRA